MSTAVRRPYSKYPKRPPQPARAPRRTLQYRGAWIAIATWGAFCVLLFALSLWLDR